MPRGGRLPNAPDTQALTPDPKAVERFRTDFSRIAGTNTTDPLLIAVSGGADSVGLLLLARAALGDRCHAATVDHGLRAESAGEAAFVAGICGARNIPHMTLSGTFPDRADRTLNLSARARAFRYRLLDAYADAIGAPLIATAHHADDQLETMIMRLNRGAGLAGLASIREHTGRVIRPLLGWRAAELASIVAACGIAAVDDPSNRDDRFDRARLRKAIAGADWLDPLAAARSAHHLAEAEAVLDWATNAAIRDRTEIVGDSIRLRAFGLPVDLRRRLVEHCVRHVDPAAECRGPLIARLLTTLTAGGRATLGRVLALVDKDCWVFRPAPARKRAS